MEQIITPNLDSFHVVNNDDDELLYDLIHRQKWIFLFLFDNFHSIKDIIKVTQHNLYSHSITLDLELSLTHTSIPQPS